MAVDGSLVFDTRIDTDGMVKDSKTVRSEVAKLAAEYKKQGMNASEAFKKAWGDTERQSKDAATKTKQHWQDASKKSGQYINENIGGSINGISAVFKKFALTVGTIFGATQLVRFGKQATEIASDLEEVQNVVDVSFGDMAYRMEEFAKTSIETFGMSQLAAKETGSSFMAMAKGMKFPAEAAADMALELTALSADMASFYNITQSESRTALASIYTGETETLKRYGVLMTEVNLQEYARQKGITKTIEKMTQQEKVMLRYSYVTEALALAQGDFARTSDSWANQTRVLSETWKEFLAVLGSGVIRVLSPLIRYLTQGISYLISMANTVSGIYNAVFGANMDVVESTTDIRAGAVDAAEGYSEIGDAAEEAGKKASKAVAPFDKLNQAATGVDSASNISIDVPSIDIKVGKTTEQTSNQIAKSFDDLKKSIEPTLESLDDFKDALGDIAIFGFDNIKSLYNDMLVPIGRWVLGEGLPRFLDVITDLIDAIDWKDLSSSVANLNKALAPFAIKVGEGFLLFIETMAELITPLLTSTVDAFADGLDFLADVIGKISPDAAIALGGALGGLVTSILLFQSASLVMNIIKSLKGGLGTLIASLAKHPWLLVAAGIAALAGAVLALDKAKFDNSAMGQLIKRMEELNDIADEYNERVKTTLEQYDKREQDIEAEYGAISILADKYFELADKEELTAQQQALLKTYADELVKKIPELSELINAQTGAYKGTKEEIQDLINKTKEYYLVQAAQEKLVELAKLQYENERILKERQEERLNIMKQLQEVTDQYNATTSDGVVQTRAMTQEQKQNVLKSIELEGQMHNLERQLAAFDDTTQETIDSQKKINKEWDYATDYISDYSTQVEKDMDKVKRSVNDALTDVEKQVKAVKLPPLLLKLQYDDPGYTANLRVSNVRPPAYASGNVIPANYGNFLAVLGDNKKEPEVVSPVSKIEEAVENVLNRRGGSDDGPAHYTIMVGNKVLFDGVVEADKEYKKQTGKSAFAN